MSDDGQSQVLQLSKARNEILVGRDNRRAVLRMNAFVREYERLCGNVSATCERTGISRRTYYRWMNGDARIYRRFQKKILKILPGEKLVDAAECSIMELIAKRDVAATIFTLKTQGKHRGWAEERKQTNVQVNVDVSEKLNKIAASFQDWIEDNPDASLEEKVKWLGRFARGGDVEQKELARKVGLEVEG